MLFDSLQFFIFFPAVTTVYFAIPHRFRWIWLLLASTYFYISFIPAYMFVLGAVIVISYTGGLLMYHSRAGSVSRRRTMGISVTYILLILFVFKYFNFVSAHVGALTHFLGWRYTPSLLALALPLGISFHTFQCISYLADVYRGTIRPQRHPGYFALYVMFYPKLVAGPIERAGHLLPQLTAPHRFSPSDASTGLKQMTLGLFKKMVIADRLDAIVRTVFAQPHSFTGLPVAIAVFAFYWQMYCDFSGYSDIAIGAARVMGIQLTQNFRMPYMARSVREFWRRWHISLMDWFRDYVYIPLGGNRVSLQGRIRNTLATFLVSGLWHGAGWTFVLWGGIHGAGVLASAHPHYTKHRRMSVIGIITDVFRIGATFGFVSMAWIFFRAATVSDALYILTRFLDGISGLFIRLFTYDTLLFTQYLRSAGREITVSLRDMEIIMVSLILMFVTEYLQHTPRLRGTGRLVQWPVYLSLVLSILNWAIVKDIPFIYFQF